MHCVDRQRQDILHRRLLRVGSMSTLGMPVARLPDPGPIGILALQVGPLGRGEGSSLGSDQSVQSQRAGLLQFSGRGFLEIECGPSLIIDS